MLYKLKSGVSPRELNPGLDVVETFSKLEDRQLMFVLIFCDPSKDNPVKTLSGRRRREEALMLAGYKMEADGKRLDRNGREIVYGNNQKIEEAIEEYKRLHYSQTEHNREALKKQITEIREFLESDKRIPLIEKGKIVLDKHGKEIYITDQKALKLAVELGVKLPELEEAYNKLEEPVDLKFESDRVTAADIPEEVIQSDQPLNSIEIYHQTKQKK